MTHPTLRTLALTLTATLTTASATAEEPAASPNAARCGALVDRFIAESRSAAQDLGVTLPEHFDGQFRNRLMGYDAACGSLTEEQLACVEAGPSALVAVGTCRINEGRDFQARVNLPMLAADFIPWQVHKQEMPSDDTTAAVTASLVGAWRTEDSWARRTFTVSADGTAAWEEVRNGETTTSAGRLDVMSPWRVVAKMGMGDFNWAFFVDGDRVLFSNQTATGAYPVAATGPTQFGHNGQFYVAEGLESEAPVCRGYGPRFDAMPITCRWIEEEGVRKLSVDRGEMWSIESGTKMFPYATKFLNRDGVLIPDGTSMFWTRVP